MTNVILFNLLLVPCCVYAIIRGGAPERATAGIYLIAGAASALLPYHPFSNVEATFLLVDFSVLAAIGLVAIKADRFWPLWSAAIQAVVVTIHGAKAFDPSILAYVYFVTTSNLAYPMVLMLAVGTLRHRQRITTFGGDPPWSSRREADDERGTAGQARRE